MRFREETIDVGRFLAPIEGPAVIMTTMGWEYLGLDRIVRVVDFSLPGSLPEARWALENRLQSGLGHACRRGMMPLEAILFVRQDWCIEDRRVEGRFAALIHMGGAS